MIPKDSKELSELQCVIINKKISEFTNSIQYKCYLCGNNKLCSDKSIYKVSSISGEVCLPLYSLVCEKCGNTIFINLKLINFLDSKGKFVIPKIRKKRKIKNKINALKI